MQLLPTQLLHSCTAIAYAAAAAVTMHTASTSEATTEAVAIYVNVTNVGERFDPK